MTRDSKTNKRSETKGREGVWNVRVKRVQVQVSERRRQRKKTLGIHLNKINKTKSWGLTD